MVPAKRVNGLIEDVLRHEGGYTDDSTDRGHNLRVANGDKYDSYCTNLGITQATLSGYYCRQATIEEVKKLPVSTAKLIYTARYYRNPRIDWLPDMIQPLMLDMSINHGPRNAVRILQGLLRKAGFDDCVKDGRIGPATKAMMVTLCNEMTFQAVNALVEERLAFYRAIIDNKPEQGKFWKGWERRALSFQITQGEQYA